MSRAYFPKLQLPPHPKSVERGEGAHKHYHGAYVPPPAEKVEVANEVQLSNLIYNSKTYIAETGRPINEETGLPIGRASCSDAFIAQCNLLFQKMRQVHELAIL